MLAKNVVKLNENVNVYDQIQKYLTKLGYDSERTKADYHADIKMYFKLMKGKELEYLDQSDVNLSHDDFEDYIQRLYTLTKDDGSKYYSNKTINRRIVSLKGLLRYLYAKKIVKDVSFFELVKSLPENSNQYGVLETHEVFEMARLAFHEREKGAIKRLAILFSLDTCIRKSALLSLKWSNFVVREDGVLVNWVDKGNKDFRQMIGHDFYNELLTIKEDNSEYVFNISPQSIDDLMKRLRTKMNIQKERNVVWHSIRKSGVSYRYRITGDILEAQRAAGHSNVTTTQIYIKHEDYGALGAVSSGGKIDHDLYKEVDHETLVKAISMCKKDLQLILNVKLQELIKQK